MTEGLDTNKINAVGVEGKIEGKEIRPIFVCLIDSSTEKDYTNTEQILEIKNTGHNIYYGAEVEDLNSKGELNDGKFTYVISNIDNSNKYSEDFKNCTGVVVAGINKNGEKISFMSHENSGVFLDRHIREFTSHLDKRMLEMQDLCIKGSIDVIILGGKYLNQDNYYKKSYEEALALLSTEIEKILTIKPQIINGPKIDEALKIGPDSAYYNNNERVLYFVRPKINPETGSFTVSQTKEEENKWK